MYFIVNASPPKPVYAQTYQNIMRCFGDTMQRVLGNLLCDIDLKEKLNCKKASICDGVPSTAALVDYCFGLED